jgi:hypothetical protein
MRRGRDRGGSLSKFFRISRAGEIKIIETEGEIRGPVADEGLIPELRTAACLPFIGIDEDFVFEYSRKIVRYYGGGVLLSDILKIHPDDFIKEVDFITKEKSREREEMRELFGS